MRTRPDSKFQILGSTRSGFTLVEILVVIGVTALLSSLIVTYTSTSRDQVALSIEQAKLAQMVSRAKSLSLATYGREEVPCGYGVYIDYSLQEYTLFAYPPGACADIPRVDPDTVMNNAVDKVALPKNVRLRASEDALGAVLFIPPDPRTLIWQSGDNATSTFGKIILNPPSGSPQKSVEVGVGGQITF